MSETRGPQTVLEALACGVPVACSSLPHLRDAFGDAVCYFEVGDIGSLERCLTGLNGQTGQVPAAVTD